MPEENHIKGGFSKADPRINRNGRPRKGESKSELEAKELLQAIVSVAHENMHKIKGDLNKALTNHGSLYLIKILLPFMNYILPKITKLQGDIDNPLSLEAIDYSKLPRRELIRINETIKKYKANQITAHIIENEDDNRTS